jgi:acetyl-CoA carboxylase carboxyl transferase subunit alpha
MQMSRLRVPIVAIVIGEGGSGGALALGVSDRLYMLEHSVYSVISPEGCAAILWRKNGEQNSDEIKSRAAEALKLTAQDLLQFKIIDDIIQEPVGGAHRGVEQTAKNIADKIVESLEELKTKTAGKLVEERYKRLRRIGSYVGDA